MEQNFRNHTPQAELADIQTIAVDQTLSKEERIAEFLRQIKNPYCFKCGKLPFRHSFPPTGVSLEDCLKQIPDLATLMC